jgi:predicted DNA-binding protein
MLEIEDFYLDKLVLRQVKRQEAQAAAELEDDLVDVVPATQRNKP